MNIFFPVVNLITEQETNNRLHKETNSKWRSKFSAMSCPKYCLTQLHADIPIENAVLSTANCEFVR